MSAHLGPALSSYVDGELAHDLREQVQVHLAHCGQCRDEAAGLRLLKGALRLEAPSAPPSDLAARVLAATSEPGHPAPIARLRRPRRAVNGAARRTALAFGAVAFGAGSALALAGPPPSAPLAPVDPTSAGLVTEHVSTSNEVPFAGSGVMPAGASVAESAVVPVSDR
jgi:anti-sigma factor RsiW